MLIFSKMDPLAKDSINSKKTFYITFIQNCFWAPRVVQCLASKTGKSEFESHWVPHSIGPVPHRSKELRKLHYTKLFCEHLHNPRYE